MDFSKLKDEEVVNIYPEVLKELKSRGIIKTNNLIGDLGEYLAIKTFLNAIPGWLIKFSTKIAFLLLSGIIFLLISFHFFLFNFMNRRNSFDLNGLTSLSDK